MLPFVKLPFADIFAAFRALVTKYFVVCERLVVLDEPRMQRSRLISLSNAGRNFKYNNYTIRREHFVLLYYLYVERSKTHVKYFKRYYPTEPVSTFGQEATS